MSVTTQMLDARRAAAREAEANDEKAQALDSLLVDLRADVARLERRAAMFAELGDRHVEIPRRTFDERYRHTITWEPIMSVLSGLELAKEVEGNLPHLRAEIAKTEREIKQLLK